MHGVLGLAELWRPGFPHIAALVSGPSSLLHTTPLDGTLVVAQFPIQSDSLIRALYLERPNPFLVKCRLDGGKVVDAYLPNPGRLLELLLPDTRLILTASGPGKGTAPRKTRFTVLALERDGTAILLHTHLCNEVARHLLENDRIPALVGAEILGSEVPLGRNRFDFLLRHGGWELYLEVKSCTLFGNGVAMFPDAITARGRKHLEELAELSRSGVQSAVLFVAHTRDVDWFMPDYHTDLAFSRSLLSVREEVEILPAAVEWSPDLSLSRDVKMLDVPWSHLEREVVDTGSYLLLFEVGRDLRLGREGGATVVLRRGHYLYVGLDMGNLTRRINRHLRGTGREAIDDVIRMADRVTPLAVRSPDLEGCEIARALTAILEPVSGVVDPPECDCHTHLLFGSQNPLDRREFHAILSRYRMKHPT